MEKIGVFVHFLIMLLLNTTAGTLTCYQCSNLRNISACNLTADCGPDELCYATSEGTGQHLMYTLGCMGKQQCPGKHVGIVGRAVSPRPRDPGCDHCCSQNACNKALCSRPTTGGQTLVMHGVSKCADDPIKCPVIRTTFNICSDILRAKNICRKFCGLCDLRDGGWSCWSRWSACNVRCGTGRAVRTRTCTDPAPVHGGLDCVGNSTDYMTCNLQPCPSVDSWSDWSSWGTCSTTCGVGLQHRNRTCSTHYPGQTGNHCFGDSRDYNTCELEPCTEIMSAFTAKNPYRVWSNLLRFASVVYSSGNDYSATSGKFTCRHAGLYYFSLTLVRSYSHNTIQYEAIYATIYKGSQTLVRAYSDPTDDDTDYGSYSASASTTVHLVTGDVVFVGGSSRSTPLSSDSSFSGFLVRSG